MINQQITQYVADERARGVLDADIKKALLEKGWDVQQVEEAIKGKSAPSAYKGSAFMNLFEGRVDHKNYFFALLAGIIIELVLMLTGSFFLNMLSLLLVPIGYGMGMRRFHDLGQSGWFTLLTLIPFIGLIVTIYLAIKKGDSGVNSYGAIPDPKRPFLNALLNN